METQLGALASVTLYAGVAIALAAACESAPPAPAPAPAPGLSAAPPPLTASPARPVPPPRPPPGSATDDLPHTRARLAWLADVRDCIPRAAALRPSRGQVLMHHLDAYDGRLVLCAQVPTRRDVSVFFDMVSYACWDVDPATGAVSRRADLGRSYFDCQDGSCPPEHPIHASYDGTRNVVYSDDKRQVAIVTRPGGAPLQSFPLDADPWRLTLVGTTLFADAEDALRVLDDRGVLHTKLPQGALQILDDKLALVYRSRDDLATDADAPRSTLYDLTTHTATPLDLPERYVAGAVRHRGTIYAVDSARHTLVTLDPKTLEPRRSILLPRCAGPGATVYTY